MIIEIEEWTTHLRHLYKIDDDDYRAMKLDCEIIFDVMDRYQYFIKVDECNLDAKASKINGTIRITKVYQPRLEEAEWRLTNKIREHYVQT